MRSMIALNVCVHYSYLRQNIVESHCYVADKAKLILSRYIRSRIDNNLIASQIWIQLTSKAYGWNVLQLNCYWFRYVLAACLIVMAHWSSISPNWTGCNVCNLRAHLLPNIVLQRVTRSFTSLSTYVSIAHARHPTQLAQLHIESESMGGLPDESLLPWNLAIPTLWSHTCYSRSSGIACHYKESAPMHRRSNTLHGKESINMWLSMYPKNIMY